MKEPEYPLSELSQGSGTKSRSRHFSEDVDCCCCCCLPDSVFYSCALSISSSLAPDRLRLSNINPKLLVTAQWPWFSSRWYCVYRMLVACIFFTLMLVHGLLQQSLYQHRSWLWFFYATNCALLLLLIASVLQAINCFLDRKRIAEDDFSDWLKPPTRLQLQWLLLASSQAGVITVCLVYWTVLEYAANPVLETFGSKVKHVLSAVYVLLDLLLAATPVRAAHVLYPLLVAVLYSIFNGLAFGVFGVVGLDHDRYIYPPLQWLSRPGLSIFYCLVLYVVLVCVHLLCAAIAHIRMKVFCYLYPNKASEINNTESGQSSERSRLRESSNYPQQWGY